MEKLINGTSANRLIVGTSGNDVLTGDGGNDTLDGGTGNDQLNGGAGNNVYLFGRGEGQDIISSYDTTAYKVNTIRLKNGVAENDIRLSRSGNGTGYDLVLSINGSTDSITVSNFFHPSYATEYRIEQIEFSDGAKIWDSATILAKTLLGDVGDNYLFGFDSDDLLSGEDGADQLSGLAGNDTLRGGSGNDNLAGGDGNDVLDGGAGNDVLAGGTGNNTYLFARGDGQDVIYSPDGAVSKINTVQFKAGVSANEVRVSRSYGGTGADLIISIDDSADRITVTNFFAGAGASDNRIDQIKFSDGNVVWDSRTIAAKTLLGDDADNSLLGYGSDDLILGNGGADTLIGNGGNDTLDGGNGNDILNGGVGNNVYLFGRGAGRDIINSYDETANKLNTIQFKSGVAESDIRISRSGNGVGTDLIVSIFGTDDKITVSNFFSASATNQYRVEQFKFTDGGAIWNSRTILSKTLLGDDADNNLLGYGTDDVLLGNGGNDTLSGSAGNDTLDGGIGNDVLNGGTGNNVYLFGRNGGQDIINSVDYTSGKINTIQLKAGVAESDVRVSRSGNGQGTDLIIAIRDTEDRITVLNFFNGSNQNEYRIEQIRFTDGGSVWNSNTIFAKTLIGDEMDNYLQGYGADDLLMGNGGADNLSGNAGNDTLDGGTGNDMLNGGVGDNVYLFGRGAGQDTITSFDDASEKLNTIQLKAGVAEADVRMARSSNGSGYDLILSIVGTSDKITVANFFNPSYFYEYRIEQVKFTDGAVTWDSNTILAKTLIGDDGDNYLLGYGSDDRLVGGVGNDNLIGGAGNDTLDGGAGNDVLNGGTGNNLYLFGRGGGQDVISSSDNTNSAKLNTIQLLTGIDPSDIRISRSNSGYGVDLVISILGTSDSFTVSGFFNSAESGIEQIKFTDGGTLWNLSTILAKTLIGDDADNTLYGYGSDDLLMGNGGNDYIVGGDGFDIASYTSASGAVSASLTSNSANDGRSGVDTLQSIEGLIGGNFNDTLTGNEFANLLKGQGGNDNLQGLAGNDTIWGEVGNDTIDGGSGRDVAAFQGVFADYTINYAGGVISIVDNNLANGNEGSDSIRNVEVLQFANRDVTLVDGLKYIASYGDLITLYGANADAGIAHYLRQGVTEGRTASFDAQIYIDKYADVRALVGGDLNAATLHYINSGFGDGRNASITSNDNLSGTSGNDAIYAYGGNDTIFGGAGNDTIDGGSGTDTASFSGGFPDYTFAYAGGLLTVTDNNLSNGNEGIDKIRNVEILHFANRDVTLVDGLKYIASYGDLIALYGTNADAGVGHYLRQGVDEGRSATFDAQVYIDKYADVRAAVGNDLTAATIHFINTGFAANRNASITSDDNLTGTSGNDTILSYGGNDTVLGAAGNDVLTGGAGNDSLNGGTGIDTADYATATSAVTAEIWRGTASNDGQGGSDILVAIENLSGGAFNDLLAGDEGANSLNGQAGNDNLYGGGGNDTLLGGSGNDLLAGGAGNDNLNGGDGIDTLDYSSATGNVTAEIWRGTASSDGQGGSDVLGAVENLIGGNFNDLLAGDEAANSLSGMAGNDKLFAGGGNDTLIGGAGNDQLCGGAGLDSINGGDGIDTADYTSATSGVTAELWRGTASNDGQGGNDVLLFVENLQGGNFNDLLAGDEGANSLSGGAGNDNIYAGGGADTLVGGTGNDNLYGNAGADTFRFDTALNAVSNIDTLGDFSAVDDIISLAGSIFSAIAPGTLGAGSLRAGAGVTTAADADDFILYNSTTGALYYDADGSGVGAAVQFAVLPVGLALTNADFVVA